MADLHTNFSSGGMLTAGSFTGQADGASGLNFITNRINTESGILGTVSGAGYAVSGAGVVVSGAGVVVSGATVTNANTISTVSGAGYAVSGAGLVVSGATVTNADTISNTSTGHDHDGTDSKFIPYSVFGDGSDGALNITTGTTNITAGIKKYTSINISTGATLGTSSSDSSETIILLCQGDVTINGTINLKGKGKVGGASQVGEGNGSSGSSVTDDCSTCGANGTRSGDDNAGGGGGGGYSNGANGGKTGIAVGGIGGTGWSSKLSMNMTLLKHTLIYQWHPVAINGSGGASGTSKGGTSATGGTGGMSLIIIAKGNISIGAAGDIDCRGNTPSAATGDAGGSGGGGGGSIMLRHLGTYSNSGAIQVTGGSGGTGADGNGGAGGTGNALVLQLNGDVFQ